MQNKTLTYGQINQQANQLAHYLRDDGLRREDIIAICMERSLEMIIAIVGILKADAAYLPLNPAYPYFRVGQGEFVAELAKPVERGLFFCRRIYIH
ncbi:MAG: mcnC [Gammaproteobacteria bacterium]|nr:mcnC [Gammaproteobacteria bacterium]